jgi:hypothetical protein
MNNQKGFIGIILTIIITALLIGGATYFWQQQVNTKLINDKTNQLQQQSQDQVKILQEKISDLEKAAVLAENEDTNHWQTYTNEDLNISFDYPKTWGGVKIKYVDETMSLEEASPLVYSGQGAYLTFDVGGPNLLFASENFDQFLMNPYKGDADLAKGCNILNDRYYYNKDYCRKIKVAGQDTVEDFYNLNMECSGEYIVHEVLLNIKTVDKYTGLKIYTGTPDLPIDETEERKDICGRNADNIEANLQAIYSRENLNEDIKQSLEDFDRFLSSFKFLD